MKTQTYFSKWVCNSDIGAKQRWCPNGTLSLGYCYKLGGGKFYHPPEFWSFHTGWVGSGPNVRSSGVIDGRLAAIAQASISNLRCERQLEISIQEARKRRPDLSDDALLELAKTVHPDVISVWHCKT